MTKQCLDNRFTGFGGFGFYGQGFFGYGQNRTMH